MFFPEKGFGSARQIESAKKLCLVCPVLQACNSYKDAVKPSDGVWAGSIVNNRSKK